MASLHLEQPPDLECNEEVEELSEAKCSNKEAKLLRVKPHRGLTGIVWAENGQHAIQCGTHLERPERVSAIIKHLGNEGLIGRCKKVECRQSTQHELASVHSESHIQEVLEVREAMLIEDDSMYLTPGSFECAGIAAGSLIELVQGVVDDDLLNGIALVRPPGHHVEIDAFAGGFGVFNNVAMAAKAALDSGVERVLIVDWDVHHGNGTQHIFEEDPSVMYFSIHRYDNGTFFPCSKDAAPEVIGRGAGQGYNVNVAWNISWKDYRGMGDNEYLSAFQCVLLPIALEFKPQLILVSAGFDAAAGDVGGCCVSPAGFAQMTAMLQAICPKVVLALEGGYKLNPMAECISACTRALLGDDFSQRCEVRPKHEARLSIERTLRSLRSFWNSLRTSEQFDLLTITAIPITCVSSLAVSPFIDVDVVQLSEESKSVQEARAPRRCKKPKEKHVTGISISTRNAASSNWKGDMKKMSRKVGELESNLQKIEHLKSVSRSRMSAKDRALIENEEDFLWELEEVRTELRELTSLSKNDVLRMYSGCG
mmetsp:Transcript_105275/g.164143  ORF Transcript_105275/g.164143 Transcript_105275/m.164143 type:complete len:539 (-) Transcript_105275:129-1745(-)